MTDLSLDEPRDFGLGASAALLRTRFSAEVDEAGGTTVLTLQGDLDLATAPRLRRALGAVLDQRPHAVVVDLSNLAFVDTSGVRVLRAAAVQAGSDGCAFTLRWPSRAVRKTLSLTGIDQLLAIEERPSVA